MPAPKRGDVSKKKTSSEVLVSGFFASGSPSLFSWRPSRSLGGISHGEGDEEQSGTQQVKHGEDHDREGAETSGNIDEQVEEEDVHEEEEQGQEEAEERGVEDGQEEVPAGKRSKVLGAGEDEEEGSSTVAAGRARLTNQCSDGVSGTHRVWACKVAGCKSFMVSGS